MKTIQKSVVLLLLCSVFIACKNEQKEAEKNYTEAEVAEHSKRLNDWFQEQFQLDLKASPEMQTRIGDKTDYGKWDDISPEAEEKQG